MILINELKGLIVAKGFSNKEIAKELGITSKTLYNKFKKGVFGSREMEKLINILDIKDPAAIFFANNVTYEETPNTPKQEN